MALYNHEKTFEGVVTQLRNVVHIREQPSRNFGHFSTSSNYKECYDFDQNYIERKFAGQSRFLKNNEEARINGKIRNGGGLQAREVLYLQQARLLADNTLC